MKYTHPLARLALFLKPPTYWYIVPASCTILDYFDLISPYWFWAALSLYIPSLLLMAGLALLLGNLAVLILLAALGRTNRTMEAAPSFLEALHADLGMRYERPKKRSKS